jgi:hypothetical protein
VSQLSYKKIKGNTKHNKTQNPKAIDDSRIKIRLIACINQSIEQTIRNSNNKAES